LCLTSFRKGQFYAWMTPRVVECGVTSLALSLRLIAARRGHVSGTRGVGEVGLAMAACRHRPAVILPVRRLAKFG
jgi:hypothetical protein